MEKKPGIKNYEIKKNVYKNFNKKTKLLWNSIIIYYCVIINHCVNVKWQNKILKKIYKI